MIVEGTYDEFCKYFSSSLFTNLVKTKTAKAKPKQSLTCEGVGDHAPHKVDRRGQIQFCHPPGRSRPIILYEVLSRYKITPTGSAEIFRCDIAVLTNEFWQAHIPIIPQGRFLCQVGKAIYGD